jgi:hypothetical protein
VIFTKKLFEILFLAYLREIRKNLKDAENKRVKFKNISFNKT